jgi:hypothetical protein
VAQNKLVSGDHIQTALAFRLAHHEALPSSVVAYGQGYRLSLSLLSRLYVG